MSIQYSCIARGNIILCDTQIGMGNFEDVARSMLHNIHPTFNTKQSYSSTMHMFHVQVDNGITYLCAAPSDFGKRFPYAFLAEIKNRFETSSLSVRAMTAGEKEFDREFSQVMKTEMERFSRGEDATNKLQSQVDEVKGIMTENIEKVLERGEKLEDLMSKSTDLEATSMSFKKTSRNVRRKMWLKNLKMKICLGCTCFLVIAVIIIIALFATGVLPPKGDQPKPITTPAPTTPKP